MFKLLKKHWAFITVNLTIIIFFSRLFFPLSTFTTPDFGRTDILHILLPQKVVQSEGVRHFQIPLWDNKSGFGYPILAELSGFFFVPNLILIFLLPFEFAIPSMFLTTFLIGAFSMYFLLLKLKLNQLSAAFGSLAFAYSAALILRIPHLAVAQAMSIVPLAIAFNFDFVNKPNIKTGILLSIILSQILVTFTQIYVYLLILVFTLNLIIFLFSKGKISRILLAKYLLIAIFSIILSSSQLFASYDAVRLSQRKAGLDPNSILSDFPLLPRNLLTFVNPFIIGKASNGTYNSTNWPQVGVYWENTSYFGLIPFILAFLTSLYLLFKRPKNIFSAVLIASLVSILLALGKFAPLHILYSFPPLNFFRVPGRFIMFTQILLIVISAYGFDRLMKKSPKLIKIIFPLLFISLIFDFYSKWWRYHPVESINSVLSKPEIMEGLSDEDLRDYRLYSIGTAKTWNQVFEKYGWDGKEDYYKFFRNSLEPNTNLFYNISHFSSYQILPSRRQNLQQAIIPQFSKAKDDEIELKDSAKKAMDAYSIKYVVTSTPIKTGYLKKIKEVEKYGYKFWLYENPDAKKIVNFYYDYQPVTYINDYLEYLDKVDLSKTVLLESGPSKKLDKGQNEIQLNKKTPSYYDITVKTTSEGILTLSDSYSQDWKAKIDGKPAKIFPANINSKALLIPQGTHNVEIYYQPILIIAGMLISLTTYITSAFILFKKTKAH